MNRLVYFIAIILIIPLFSYSQGISIGTWRDHLPFQQTMNVTDGNDLIYAATPYSLFYYNTTDNSVNRLTKVEGLSDFGISKILFNKEYNTLVIAYTNTNIDLIKDGVIINIPDIKRKQILGKKTINNIMFKDEFAYLSCGFGIVVLDIVREEIKDTYYIGAEGSQVDVLDMTYNDTSLFAATESGLYYAGIDDPNLANFSSWSRDLTLNSPYEVYSLIEYFNNKLVICRQVDAFSSDTLFFQDGSGWKQLGSLVSNFFNLTAKGNDLTVAMNYAVRIFDQDLNESALIYQINDKSIDPQDAIIGNGDDVWIADESLGLIKTRKSGYSGTFIYPNGPASSNVYDLNSRGNDVWVAHGGRTSTWAPMYIRAGIDHFSDESWDSFVCFYQNCTMSAFDSIRDIVCVAPDPVTPGKIYAGTWGSGLIEIDGESFTALYDTNNSTLQDWSAAQGFVLVSGMDFDQQGNLWLANSGSPQVISVKTQSGNWTAFDAGPQAAGADVSKLMVDSWGQKWILMRKSHSILVFNENGTITNPADDDYKIINNSAGNGNIPGTKVLSIAEDYDGEVWIGTDEGVAVFYSPENIFRGQNFDAQRILVEWDGYVQYLLETEIVTAIEVNGNNEKWVGTDNAGVFLLSEDGTEQIHHFTTDNSPLLSNTITDIAIRQDGEVFFGTSLGVVSFRDASSGPGETSSDVYAFPNPVRADYRGPIAIKGLARNSVVKITDISGTVVFETRAEGGQAVWSGENFDGRRASTGVYLVFSANEKGEETMVTKILFVN